LKTATPREILVIKPSSLGDIVHTLPSVALLRGAFPDAKIRWLINTEWMPLLDGNPNIDEAIEFPRRDFRGLRGALRISPWARHLRERIQPDWIVDYQGLLRSGLISKLCRGKETLVFGLGDAREGARFFYDKVTDVSGCVHAVDRYLALSRDVVSSDPSWHSELIRTKPWLTVPPCPLPQGAPPAGFEENGPFVLLHPFARGAGKSLEAEGIAGFCESLAPVRVVVAGQSANRIVPAKNVLDLLNSTNLHSLIWLLRHAAFVVSVDSGPMHIAAALEAPLVSIHTWSDPAKVGPYRGDAFVWKEGRVYRQDQRDKPAEHVEIQNLSILGAFILKQLQPCA
jgi:ADP-heptose:LPS heptosyltransferase